MDEQELEIEMPAPTLRPPGWQLVSGTGGVRGWHLINQVHAGNSVTTSCGLVGRVITTSEQVIVQCPVCLGTLPG